MRSVLPCSYVPKHAAPREPLGLETRAVLAAGLAVAVLPLGGSPALADDVVPAAGSATQTATTAAPAAEAPAAAPAVEAPVAAQPAPSPYSVGAVAPKPAARKASTSLRFTTGTSRRTAVPVGIRLLADGRGVRNGYVRLEKSTATGWTYAGRLLTGPDGVGQGTLKVAGSTKLRAAYTGSQVRTPAVSQPRTVRAKSVAAAAEASEAPEATTAPASTSASAVLREAASHVGKPYRYGSVGPDAFDCSGFTRYVFGQVGKELPHNSGAQERVATPVSKADARPGDLVFIQDVAGHVGIYAGNGQMYDAPRSGKTVTLRSIWTSNFTVGRV